MRSLCRNCVGFGECGLVAFCNMKVLQCPDYKRGKENHGQDVYVEVEVKRGRKLNGLVEEVSGAVDNMDEIIEDRVKKLLWDFPADFRSKQLKDAYSKKYKEQLTFTKELRDKVCRPYKQGLLINKCKKRKHTRTSVQS